MLISENERFGQEINADQRLGLFSAHFQLVLDQTKAICSVWRRIWKLPLQTVFNKNEPYCKKKFPTKNSILLQPSTIYWKRISRVLCRTHTSLYHVRNPSKCMSTLLIIVCVLTENPPILVNHAGCFEGYYVTVYGDWRVIKPITYICTYSQDIRVFFSIFKAVTRSSKIDTSFPKLLRKKTFPLFNNNCTSVNTVLL